MVSLLLIALLLFSALPAHAEPPAPAARYRGEVIRAQHLYLPDVPVNWLAGQIHQESRWRADVRSRVGAVGLMQVMPAASKDIARLCGMPGFDPLNPRSAIMGGICFDAILWRAMKNRLPTWTVTREDRWYLTLRSFNGGSGWLYREAAILRELGLVQGPAVWLGSVCRELRSAASCEENLTYPHAIMKWARLYLGWN